MREKQSRRARGLPERKPQRWREYDYSRTGAYFVTINVCHRQRVLGVVRGGVFVPSQQGLIVMACWHELTLHFQGIVLDSFVVMPNHVHGIIRLEPGAGSSRCYYSLPEVIRSFKSFSSRKINERPEAEFFRWHKSFHDRIIRDKRLFNKLCHLLFKI